MRERAIDSRVKFIRVEKIIDETVIKNMQATATKFRMWQINDIIRSKVTSGEDVNLAFGLSTYYW